MSPSDRCGHRPEIGRIEGSIDIETCDRATWDDYDRCVWHAEVDGKTRDDLERFRPEVDESIHGAYLREATLVGIDWLAGRGLVGADLSDADITGVDFSEADLRFARLSGITALDTDFTGANLEAADLSGADLRRASLVDARFSEAVFTDVHIGRGTTFGDVSVYERKSIEPTGTATALEAAAWMYRELRQIYSNNALPARARRSYTQEKDVRRRIAWIEGDYRTAIKWELSRWVMYYGSSPYRILATSLAVILVAAVLYPLTGELQEVTEEAVISYTVEDPSEAPPWWLVQVFAKSFYFSVVTFATLGYGDIQPVGTWARWLAGVETITGSLLSALLVFVLARNVTW